MAALEEVRQAASFVLNPSTPIEPAIPDEHPAEQPHDSFPDSWVSSLWEQAGDDLPSSFDTFEAFEFGQPSCAAF